MAISKVLRYLESRRNLVGCAAGAGGVGLSLAGLTGGWGPAVIVALYLAGAIIVPPSASTSMSTPPAALGPGVELTGLAERVAAIGLPSSVGAEQVLAALGAADPGRVERIVRWELPVALDGYVRARCWEALAPGGVDPTAALKAELDRMSGLL
ncbi:hypothetical protein ACIRPK_25050 [Kitasatospora sp. NPDC101801]|uniref:hypothetical protein n=1 Tax=Kitasatospora sp. NPDC101801 TaxID=3364103 RepID=UPI00382BA168